MQIVKQTEHIVHLIRVALLKVHSLSVVLIVTSLVNNQTVVTIFYHVFIDSPSVAH